MCVHTILQGDDSVETWIEEMQAHKIGAQSFEGWYFRISDHQCSIAMIVGISNERDNEHAFIQTLDTISRQSQYIRFPLTELHICDQPFSLRYQNNVFTLNGISLHLKSKVNIQMNISFKEMTKLQSTRYAPNIMGPFAYLKQMECIHSIISTTHCAYGTLQIQGQSFQIMGRGYIEKDRGVSFPKHYLWIQSNQCIEKPATFFMAIAHIPLHHIQFQGIIALLEVAGKQYRFGSYYGAIARTLKETQDASYVGVYQGLWRMYLKLEHGSKYPLIAPKHGAMGPKVMEGLEGKLTLHLYYGKKCVTKLHFSHCGNELHC